MIKIFLVRHATPDWKLKHIPYDIHPGPPLSIKGEQEAEAVAAFLKAQGVVKLYSSPFERSNRTAQIISTLNKIPCTEEIRLAEWRAVDEKEDKLRERMSGVFDEISRESAVIGPIALVSHGSPIAFLLLTLGLDKDQLSQYRKKFDGSNPLPPAGVWAAEWNEVNKTWNLKLIFIPLITEEVQ
jgi:broad specificity phosphatase PhoE